jgi:hypothetical protein
LETAGGGLHKPGGYGMRRMYIRVNLKTGGPRKAGGMYEKKCRFAMALPLLQVGYGAIAEFSLVPVRILRCNLIFFNTGNPPPHSTYFKPFLTADQSFLTTTFFRLFPRFFRIQQTNISAFGTSAYNREEVRD